LYTYNTDGHIVEKISYYDKYNETYYTKDNITYNSSGNILKYEKRTFNSFTDNKEELDEKYLFAYELV